MNIIENKTIAIVGGGPGGLTLARLLQISGAEVNVYERDLNKDARMQGATLDLHDDSGLKALRAAGLMDAVIANYRPGADRVRVMNKHAQIILEDDVNKEGQLSRPEIDRGPLQNILLDSLLPGTVVWNSQFVTMSSNNGCWKLEFKNGTSAYADIVIAADGANSRIRPYVTEIKPFYVGVTALEGAVYNSEAASPHMHKLLNGGKIFAMGNDKTLIVSSKGDGSLVFYPSFKTGENWIRESEIDFSDKAQVLAWFKAEYAGWDDAWLELFESASTRYMPRPIYCMPLDQTWEPLPNLTLLGDAAHLMPPYAGEGVNMAMLDALELSECLINGKYPDLLPAIAAYETQMRLRAAESAQQSLDSMDILHSPEALPFLVQIIS
jgi:2-polyprenyl-6-methoxyphenol hydroxylase-like FAD-dependent oxidoreductase